MAHVDCAVVYRVVLGQLCQAQLSNAESDPLARTVDDEVSRLGFQKLDILKLSFSSLDLLRTGMDWVNAI